MNNPLKFIYLPFLCFAVSLAQCVSASADANEWSIESAIQDDIETASIYVQDSYDNRPRYSEYEVLKRKLGELILRFEILGISDIENGGGVSKRILDSVSDLKICEENRIRLNSAITKLREAISKIAAKTACSAKCDLNKINTEIESISYEISELCRYTGYKVERTRPAEVHGSVISTNEDLGIVVVNFGGKHGVKVGIPLLVNRDGENIAEVRLVDVRDKMSGAVITKSKDSKTKIMIGDSLSLKRSF